MLASASLGNNFGHLTISSIIRDVMNRSSKGFGLAGVLITVIVLTVAAMMSATATSSDIPQHTTQSK